MTVVYRRDQRWCAQDMEYGEEYIRVFVADSDPDSDEVCRVVYYPTRLDKRTHETGEQFRLRYRRTDEAIRAHLERKADAVVDALNMVEQMRKVVGDAS